MGTACSNKHRKTTHRSYGSGADCTKERDREMSLFGYNLRGTAFVHVVAGGTYSTIDECELLLALHA